MFTSTWIFSSFLSFILSFPFYPWLVSCFFPGCRVLGELGFCELEKERTSIWSALISVEKDLIGPGFWDHYLSFSFIKSVMRKFKIKGFVNWIPVWKGGTYGEVNAKACRWATGNNTRLELLWQRSCAEVWKGGRLWQSLGVSRDLQLCEPFNPLPGYSPLNLQLLFESRVVCWLSHYPVLWVLIQLEWQQASHFISSWFSSWFIRRRSRCWCYLSPFLGSQPSGTGTVLDSCAYNKSSNSFEYSRHK